MTNYSLWKRGYFGLLGAAVALTGACAGLPTAAPPPVPEPPAEPIVTAPPAPSPDPALQRRIAELELRLLEKEQQNRELQLRLDDARREVVRAMGRLQSLASRAEAASGMAEAEVALQALPETAPVQGITEARELMKLSTAEFNKQNYGGALYLASQARNAAALVRQQLDGSDRETPLPGEAPFAVPLPLQTTTASNVRRGPGLGFEVLFVLPAEAPITGYSSAQQWLSITDDAGRRGWISQSLIRQRL